MTATLASVEVLHEIISLSTEANVAADKSQPDRWAAVFTENGIFDSSLNGVYTGRESLRAFALDFTSRVKGRHFTANHVVMVDGDEATQECYLIFTVAGRVKTTGQYNDRLVRVNGKWRFAHRVFVHDKAEPVAAS
jgi:hypothetical protein